MPGSWHQPLCTSNRTWGIGTVRKIFAELIGLISDKHHVVVMDPSAKGDNFARLVACVGALRYQHVNQAAGKALYSALAKPKDQRWKNALKCAAKWRTGWALREKMREHYVDHL